MNEKKRKGARVQKDVPYFILERLNKGLIESINLTEWLCVDHITLIKNILLEKYQTACLNNVNNLKSKSVMSMIKSIGETLCLNIKQKKDERLFKELKIHKSDSVRCWATYIVGSDTELSIHQKLELIQHFAADSHFGVREIVPNNCHTIAFISLLLSKFGNKKSTKLFI